MKIMKYSSTHITYLKTSICKIYKCQKYLNYTLETTVGAPMLHISALTLLSSIRNIIPWNIFGEKILRL